MSASGSERHKDRPSPGYVYPHATPPDLATAFEVAFSALPSYSQPRERNLRAVVPPEDASVMRDVAVAVATFVAGLKGEGEPPQNVLIALKTVMRRQTRRPSLDFGVYEELQRVIVLSAVKAYFSEVDPSAVPDHVLVPPDVAEETLVAASPSKPRAGVLVLVVDDDEDARYLMQTYLTSRGYEVALAEDGRDVMTIARQRRPAMVMLDIAMPYLAGTDLVQLLKADPATKDIPVVAVTGVQTLTESPDLVSIGFDDVVLKPVRRVELLRTVESRLSASA